MLYIDFIGSNTIRLSNEPEGAGRAKFLKNNIRARQDSLELIWISNTDNESSVLNCYPVAGIALNGHVYGSASLFVGVVVDTIFKIPSTASLDTITNFTRPTGKKAAILLERGANYNGSITVADDSLYFMAHGTGAKPIISGFTEVTEWTQINDTIWESTNAVSTLTTLNMVVIGGVNTPMGRTPNTGYYYFQSHVDGATSQITSTDLTGTPDWTGAEIAINTSSWDVYRCPITAQSGDTLTFSEPESFSILADGHKFIIQNDIRTLDTQNEWYYNPSTKKISIYSTTEPADVKVSTVANTVTVSSKNYVTFKNLTITGSNDRSISLATANNITVDNCDITFSGAVGVYGGFTNSNNITVTNSTFNQSNDGAIGISSFFRTATITNNTVNNTGLIYGANRIIRSSTNESNVYTAINAPGNGSTISNNVITNTGYSGIVFRGRNVTIENNFVREYCKINHDGAGIYTYTHSNDSVWSNTIVDKNIVINSATTASGTPYNMDAGIYLDGQSNNVEITDNTVDALSDYGVFLNGSENVVVENNNIFNTKYGMRINYARTSDVTIENNNFIAKASNQYIYQFNNSEIAAIADTGIVANNNKLSRPVAQSLLIDVISGTDISVATWQSTYSQDVNSTGTYDVSSSDSLLMIYNSTATAKDTTLAEAYYGVDSTRYFGTVTIQPFSSLILMKPYFYTFPFAESDLLLAYDMEETEDPLTDDSGNGTVATNTNGVQYFGASNYTLYDGVNQRFSLADNDRLSLFADTLTFEFWIYPTSLTGDRYLFSKGTSPTEFAVFFADATPVLRLWENGTGTAMDTYGPVATLNAWNHYIITYDGSLDRSGIKIYKNAGTGVNTGGGTNPITNIINTNNNMHIGGRASTTYYEGRVGVIRAWRDVLPDETTRTYLYNSGTQILTSDLY
jgi:parallel beta-helix repeat protein